MTKSSAQDDLAYIRSIAEEGRNVPLVGGTTFLIWGVLIGTTALIGYLMDVGVLPFVNQLWLWSVALTIGWGASFWFGRSSSTMAGGASLSNRTVTVAWIGCGIFITTYWLAILAATLIAAEGGFPVRYLLATMFPVAFGLYGLAFFVTAVVANQGWYRWVSVLSWTVAVALILELALPGNLYMLIAALGTYAVVAVPGYHMIRNQPSETV